MLNVPETKCTLISAGGDIMPNIKPISDLQNYYKITTKLLQSYYKATVKSCAILPPAHLFVLTKNGHKLYALLDIEDYREYEKILAWRTLRSELNKGRKSGEEDEWLPAERVRNDLKGRYSG